MSPIWILSYIVVTMLSSGRIDYKTESLEMELKTCFETMWQLDEVYAPIKEGGEYKKFIEISCKLKDLDE